MASTIGMTSLYLLLLPLQLQNWTEKLLILVRFCGVMVSWSRIS